MAQREMRAPRRMSDAEALMWNIEKDPYLSVSVANVTILDRAPDRERLRARLEHAVLVVPRLRQRVVPAPGRWAPPEWRVDPDFDIDYHLRWISLPAPGTHRQLCDVAMQLALDPFDRTRPLWEFTIVEGLEGERAAMIQKLHHTISDGEGAIRMSEQFIDLAADATEPITQGTPVEAEPAGGLIETTIDTLTHNLRRGVGITRRLVGGAAGVVLDPSLIVGTAADIGAVASSAVRQLAITDRARSPLWTERSSKRTLETLTVPFDDAHRAAKALGGSLNDVFVTAAAGGAAAYHRIKGAPIEDLRITMPISTRKDGSAGGNSFTPSRVLVPAGITDPAERFTAIHERLHQTKGERALSLLDGLAGVVNLLPTSMLVRLALRLQVETVDFATSNVRGVPFELYIAGAHIEHNFPVGPTGGTAFNLTLMSYRGQLDMGLHVDRAAIEDPALLRDCIEESFAELIAAAK